MAYQSANTESVKRKMKTAYRPSSSSLRPTYTGGPIAITTDGKHLITTLNDELLISEAQSGRRIGRVKGDGSNITAITISYPPSSSPILITAHQSLTIRYYPLTCLTDLSSDTATSSEPSPYLTYTRQISRAHPSPILLLHALVAPPTINTSVAPLLLASGAADGSVKIWDVTGGFVTHAFKGHGGPISALHFYLNGRTKVEDLLLWTGCVDTKLRCFDLLDPAHRGSSGKAKFVLDGHVSVVRGVAVADEGRWVISAGRDKVVLVWDLHATTGAGKSKKISPKIVQTILTHETLESVGFVSASEEGRMVCWTAGDKGLIRLWDVLKAKEVGRCGEEEEEDIGEDEREQRGVAHVLRANDLVIAVHNDQNILFHHISPDYSSTLIRQIIGFNDEIIDALFLSPTQIDSHLALATNSALVRVYDTTTWDARLIKGHSDVVLCLARSSEGTWLATGSKDNTARVWESVDGEWKCRVVCQGHAESVGAVVMSRKERERFLITASQDRTVKMWDLSTVTSDTNADPSTPSSLSTLRIHEKDINALDVSPNDQFLVSGSQDKLVKVFAIDYSAAGNKPASGAIRLLGTCKGHKRGVWSVKFSPTDRVVVSGAADRTIRMWSLDDFSCLKTFEGHTNSVLRVDFLTMGMQLVSTASDGLVKLWNIRDEECVKTLDGHEDKIWALAISKDEKTIVSGGADSVAMLWEDCTAEEEKEATEKREKEVAQEQDYNNYLNLGDYRRAIQLALAMDQPGRLYKLFSSIHKNRSTDTSSDGSSITGSASVDSVIHLLSPIDLVRLLKFVRDWNVRAKTSEVAQVVLNAVVRLRSPEEIREAFEKVQKSHLAVKEAEEAAEKDEDEDMEAAKPPKRPLNTSTSIGLKDLLEGLMPYTDRHAARLDKLMVESYMLDYIVGEMDGGIIGTEVIEL